MRSWLALALVACGSHGAQPSSEVQGTITVGGAPATVTACRPGREATVFVELVTATGTLRFEDKQMFWAADRAAVGRGERLACDRLERSWGGGTRLDGTSYFRGRLIFDCEGAVAVAGDVTVDCGDITAEERRQLDDNRRRALDDQRDQRR